MTDSISITHDATLGERPIRVRFKRGVAQHESFCSSKPMAMAIVSRWLDQLVADAGPLASGERDDS